MGWAIMMLSRSAAASEASEANAGGGVLEGDSDNVVEMGRKVVDGDREVPDCAPDPKLCSECPEPERGLNSDESSS